MEGWTRTWNWLNAVVCQVSHGRLKALPRHQGELKWKVEINKNWMQWNWISRNQHRETRSFAWHIQFVLQASIFWLEYWDLLQSADCELSSRYTALFRLKFPACTRRCIRFHIPQTGFSPPTSLILIHPKRCLSVVKYTTQPINQRTAVAQSVKCLAAAARPRGDSSSPDKVKNFHFFRSPRPALRPIQPSMQWVLGIFPGGKAEGEWSTSAEVKKTRIYTSTLPYTIMA
jgi:hypothetical protein